jgi:hypothetical protein
MLKKDPNERATLQQVCKHAWMQQKPDCKKRSDPEGATRDRGVWKRTLRKLSGRENK